MIVKYTRLLLLSGALLFSGCGGDNAFSGTGVIGGGSTENQGNSLASLHKNVLQSHADTLVEHLSSLNKQIEAVDANITQTDLSTMQDLFKNIVIEWKSVQSSYIAGEDDNELARVARLFDFFNVGKKLNVASDIDFALDKNISIGDALYQNSSKSITALEYLLFGNSDTIEAITVKINSNKRHKEALGIVVGNLEDKANAIATFYKNDTKFVSDAKEASNHIVNALIDSSFKLKEQRIGDASGITVKFKDRPDPARLEYAKSKLSLVAIRSILITHQEILGKQSYANFGSFASENGASEVVKNIEKQLNDALGIVDSFDDVLEEAISKTTVDAKIQKLYDKVKELQRLYFEALIQALDLTAEIIEADGD